MPYFRPRPGVAAAAIENAAMPRSHARPLRYRGEGVDSNTRPSVPDHGPALATCRVGLCGLRTDVGICVCSDFIDALDRGRRVGGERRRDHTSIGNGCRHRVPCVGHDRVAMSMRSISTATCHPCPSAAMSVGDAAPTISLSPCRPATTQFQLGLTLLPARWPQRARRAGHALSSASSSAISSGPPAACLAKDRAMRDACARCAVPNAVHHEHVAQRGILPRRASSSLPSPTFIGIFQQHHWPG